MTRELKLALIVGFSLVLVVTVLISDHLSSARSTRLGADFPEEPIGAAPAPIVPTEPDLTVALSQPPVAPLTAEAPQGTPSSPVTEIVMGRPNPAPAAMEPPTAQVADAALTQEILNRGGTITDGRFTLPAAVQPVSRQTSNPPAAALGVTLPVIGSSVGTPAPVSTTPARQHTVAEGDNLYKIAKRYYGDGNLWNRIAQHNTGRIGSKGEVRVGTKLTIPAAEVINGKPEAPVALASRTPAPNATSQGPTTARSTRNTYTVKKGDTLGKIARRELGSSKRADEIIQMNKSLLRDPDNVPLGAVLKLPTA